MKYSVTLEARDLMELVEKELARTGFRIVNGYEIDYEGPLRITVDIEPDPDLGEDHPVIAAAKNAPVPPVAPEPEKREAGSPGTAENPVDLGMGGFAAISESLKKDNPGKYPGAPTKPKAR